MSFFFLNSIVAKHENENDVPRAIASFSNPLSSGHALLVLGQAKTSGCEFNTRSGDPLIHFSLICSRRRANVGLVFVLRVDLACRMFCSIFLGSARMQLSNENGTITRASRAVWDTKRRTRQGRNFHGGVCSAQHRTNQITSLHAGCNMCTLCAPDARQIEYESECNSPQT